MAEQFVGGFGASVGLVVHFVGWDSFENFSGGAAFVFERAEEKIVEEEVSLFGGHVNHDEAPFVCVPVKPRVAFYSRNTASGRS
jgi:hypothetical protein